MRVFYKLENGCKINFKNEVGMKVLMIGMDGAHIDVFKRGWTPFISSLIEKGKQLNVKNDLISRGWLEVATGQHASVTGAMYDRPKVNGSYDWLDDFSINDIPGIGVSVKPLWQALNEEGYRVGVMNLPTTFPAPKVDGFFVSGGGGGAPVVEHATPELCYPKEVLGVLEENNYIVDERIVQLVVEKKLTTPDAIFTELAEKNKKRTCSFIKLANSYKVDFGFVVYKTSSVTAETVVTPEWQKVINGANDVDQSIIDAMKSYYHKFDSEIKKLYEAFPSAEIIFVSDHGTISRSHSVNLNIFLQESGFQSSKARENITKSVIVKLKKLLPFPLKMALKKISMVRETVATVGSFDKANSVAFCRTKNDWVHGIFINDQSRFGGPVDEKNFSIVKNNIIKLFNSHPDVVAHGLRAFSKKERGAGVLEFYPDIEIEVPSGYLTTDISSSFITDFISPKGSVGLSSVLRGDIASIKSHEPLAVVVGKTLEENVPVANGRDLTAIYDIVLKIFKPQ